MRIIRFLAGSLVAILCLEVIVRMGSPIMGPPQNSWQLQQQAKVIKLQERPSGLGRVDLVVMGDSTAKEGIDPDLLDSAAGGNFHSFNAALNSSTTYTIMRQAHLLLTTARPRYLLVLIGANTSRSSDNDPTVGIYNSADQAITNSGIKGFLNRNLFLYKYRNNIRDPFILNTIYRSIRYRSLREGVVYRNVDTLKFNGDSIFPRSSEAYAEGKWNIPTNSPIDLNAPLPEATMKHLQSLLKLCQELHVALILGTVPTSVYEPKYRNLVPSMAKKLGIGFIQGNDATTYSSDFLDGVHLNAHGASLFSQFVGEKIRALYPVP